MPKAAQSKTAAKKRFKLILQEEGTFAERWSMRVQPNQLQALAALSALVVAGITYVIIALTPLKEVVVPGYVASETRAMQANSWRVTDSLSTIVDRQSRYLNNLRAILAGDLPADALAITPEMAGASQPVAGPIDTTSTEALDGL